MNDVNGFSPAAWILSQRASTHGSVGTKNGRRVITSTSRSLPGKSTPSQKVVVPSSMAQRD